MVLFLQYVHGSYNCVILDQYRNINSKMIVSQKMQNDDPNTYRMLYIICYAHGKQHKNHHNSEPHIRFKPILNFILYRTICQYVTNDLLYSIQSLFLGRVVDKNGI